MEAKWKVNWDYLGWTAHTANGVFSQKDWNQTLHTRINELSAQINMKCQYGAANTLKMHDFAFSILNTLEYFKIHDDTSCSLGTRYKVLVDNRLPTDKIYVIYDDYPMKLLVQNDTPERVFITVHIDSPQLEECKTKKAADDSIILNIIEPNMLVGEITLLNPRKQVVDTQTGQINLEYLPLGTERDYIIPVSVERTQEDLDKILDRSKTFFKKNEPELLASIVLKNNGEVIETINLGYMKEDNARTFSDKIKNLIKTGKYE